VAGFTLIIDPGFDRDLRRIEKAGRRDVVERIQAGLILLREDPSTPRPGVDVIRLKAAAGRYRLRIGQYRILYEVDFKSRTIVVTTAYHRSRGYRV